MANAILNWPHDQSAEQAVLGVMMVDPASAVRALEVVDAVDFYIEAHQIVFNACAELLHLERACDLVVVSNKLREEELLGRVGGAAALAQMADMFPDVANVCEYGRIVHEKAVKRRLMAVCHSVLTQCEEDSGTAEDAVREAQEGVYDLAENIGPKGPVRASELTQERLEVARALSRGERQTVGLTTGFPTLDDLTGGLYPGEVTLLAARTSVGKSSFALDLARRVGEHQKRVLFLSLEMRASVLVDKLIAMKARVNTRVFRRAGFDIEKEVSGSVPFERMERAAADLEYADIYLWDATKVTPVDIRVRCRQLMMSGGLDLVVIDYVGKLRATGEHKDRHESHAEISAELARLAADLDIPVIACAQLNRDADRKDRKGKLLPPLLSNIRDSGRYEEDAHQVILLQRDVADKQTLTSVIVAKSRMGETGTRGLEFNMEQSRFDQSGGALHR